MIITVRAAAAAFLSLAVLAGCASTTTESHGPAAASATTQVVLPVERNPIVNSATTPSLQITAAAVEDNTDPATNAAIGDRLQLTLANTGTAPLSGFEIWYEMVDVTTDQREAYYQRLDGLEIAGGQTKTIFFDNESGPGHYPENQFSLYRSSANQVDFSIEVSAAGAKVATATATKGAGSGEQPD